MLDQLESNYDCSNAGEDLHNLKQELEKMKSKSEDLTAEETDRMNRLENQIHFILTKCNIR